MFRVLPTIRLKLAVAAALVVIVVLLPNLFSLPFWPHFGVDIVILVFLVYFLSTYIGRPLGALMSAAQDIGKGELSARVDVRTGDELEQLGKAFNQMAENLEKTLQDLKDQQAVQVRQARFVAEASRLFSSSLDLSETLQAIVRKSSEVAGDHNIVMLLDKATGLLNIAAHYHPDPDMNDILRRVLEDLPVRLGVGVSGAVAQTGRPMLLRDISLKDIEPAQRIIAEKVGAKSVLSVPLISRGEVIGVLTSAVVTGTRSLTEADLAIFEEIAGHAAVAIENSKLYERERRIAETLQKSYLPERIDIEDIDLATIYSPALPEAEIGGDFFDVFALDDGRIGLIIADVSGKGLQASVYTIMTKYMIRGFAVDDPAPERVLERLNKAVCRYIPQGLFITVFYGILDPRTAEMAYANAGHEPPIVYDNALRYTYNLDITGSAVGAICDSVYQVGKAALKPGDLVVLYTDGVTESRRDGCFLGLQGLQEILLNVGSHSTGEIADEIYRRVLDFSGGKLYDDVALLVAGVASGE